MGVHTLTHILTHACTRVRTCTRARKRTTTQTRGHAYTHSPTHAATHNTDNTHTRRPPLRSTRWGLAPWRPPRKRPRNADHAGPAWHTILLLKREPRGLSPGWGHASHISLRHAQLARL